MVVVVGIGVGVGGTATSTQFFLSEELVAEILTRSDAKTLFRCKSVSKSWKALISDQSFINRFISRSKSLPPSITGFFCRLGNISDLNASHYFLHTTINTANANASLSVDGTLSFLTSIHGPVAILDSSNGLLLCAKKPITFPWNHITCFVCNPITKKWVILPQTHYWNPMGGALLNSYNVDDFSSQKTQFMVYCFVKTIPHMIQVEIFNSKTGSWKPPKSYHYVWHSKDFICLTFYNGSVYWIQENGKVAVCDLDRTIRTIEMPQEHTISSRLTERWTLHLGTSAGSLHFVERSRTCFFIWVLVDGVTFHLNHVIEIESLTSLKKPIVAYEYELSPRYKFLGFHPIEYKVVLAGVNPNEAALYSVDKIRSEHVNDFQPAVFCNSYLRLIPYSLPAWPTCIPFIGNT